MNARKTIALFALFGLMIGGSATAAVNNMTSRGGFVPMRSKQAASRSTASRGFAYRAPAARSQPAYRYSAPVMQTAPAPMVAQAPEEGRRFSYSPSAPAATGVPCPPVAAPATTATVESARRYSYAPTTESAVGPAVQPAPRTYYSRPSYSGGSRSRSTGSNFPLLKTDPRKYSTR